MRCRILPALSAVALLSGCEGAVLFIDDDGETDVSEVVDDTAADVPPDTAWDTGVDTAIDVPPDTAWDTGVDTAIDVPPDTAWDTGADTAIDVPPDTSADVVPDVPCVEEGCLVSGGSTCCPGLSASRECDPSEPDCSGSRFCIDCGDGLCEPHENRYNCWNDCWEGCEADEPRIYHCSFIEMHHCTCSPPECHPECIATGTEESAWVDSCTGEVIVESDCEGQHAVCDAIGSFSEGWYESGTGNLIDWAMCAPQWDCDIIW
jgi:hypothetical protein